MLLQWLNLRHSFPPCVFRLVELNHSIGLCRSVVNQRDWIMRNASPVCILSVVKSSSGVLDSDVADSVHGQWPGGIESPERFADGNIKANEKAILSILCYVLLCNLVKKAKEIKCQSRYRNAQGDKNKGWLIYPLSRSLQKLCLLPNIALKPFVFSLLTKSETSQFSNSLQTYDSI